MNTNSPKGRDIRRAVSLVAIGGLYLFVSMFLLVCVGCSRPVSAPPHSNHGGHLIDLPGQEQMQLEFAFDEQGRKMVVYVVEARTQAPHAISSGELNTLFRVGNQDITVSLDADPLSDDPTGKASRFSLPYDKIPKPLYGVAAFTATFTFEVDGKAISGTLEHKDDHTHPHPHPHPHN